jgi:hypothetical protein
VVSRIWEQPAPHTTQAYEHTPLPLPAASRCVSFHYTGVQDAHLASQQLDEPLDGATWVTWLPPSHQPRRSLCMGCTWSVPRHKGTDQRGTGQCWSSHAAAVVMCLLSQEEGMGQEGPGWSICHDQARVWGWQGCKQVVCKGPSRHHVCGIYTVTGCESITGTMPGHLMQCLPLAPLKECEGSSRPTAMMLDA